jgi:molybdate transport system substrate-binding protein
VYSGEKAMKRRPTLIFLTSILVSVLLSLGLNLTKVSSQSSTGLTVSAAASLGEALQEIKTIYKKTQPNVNITYNFGSSGSLQQQIEQGAPVDVFISASPKQMDALQSKDLLLSGTRKDLLTNQMVLITPKSITGITGFKDLTKPQVKRIALGEPKSVPAGQYGEETLKFYGILEQIKSKLVYAKDVRQVLTYVESGNVDAGLVYITDAKSSNQVKVAATASPGAHTPIVYPVGVVRNTKQVNTAKDFVQFLSSNPAKAVFTKYGFGIAKK